MGNYYNFYAATAGSGTSTFIGEAPDSICGEGWRMAGNEGEKSWIDLFANFYGGTHQIPYPGIDGSNADTISLLSNLSFLRSGQYYWDDGDLYGRAWDGYYWSIKAYSYPYTDYLSFRPTWLVYQRGSPKGNGFSLRCVAR